MSRHAGSAPLFPTTRLPNVYEFTDEFFYNSELFHDVQQSGLYEDSKTFVDMMPRQEVVKILEAHAIQKQSEDFNLQKFVETHFIKAEDPSVKAQEQVSKKDVKEHTAQMLCANQRPPHKPHLVRGSLIFLPESYPVPGGRFQEVYYWDTFFTLLGLAAIGEKAAVENVVKNFASLIDRFGYIPNGNRTYYLGRSQPPFFALILNIFETEFGIDEAAKYLPQLEKEYAFWMTKRFDSKTGLNYYSCDVLGPRPESYREDVAKFEKYKRYLESKKTPLTPEIEEKFWRDLRGAAESGWDFSTRWYGDAEFEGEHFESTTDFRPVDLNSLLYYLELKLAHLYKHKGDEGKAAHYKQTAEARKGKLYMHCWDTKQGCFVDFNAATNNPSQAKSLAGMMPFFVGACGEADKAQSMEAILRDQFYHQTEHGTALTVTPEKSGQQWDAPNAWPPLMLVAIMGFRNVDETLGFSNELEKGWVTLTESHFKHMGKIAEKWCVDKKVEPGVGGEYPCQFGFGWSNGVFQQLVCYPGQKLDLHLESTTPVASLAF